MREANALHDAEDFNERLTLYVLGLIEAEESAAIEEHVSGCPACTSEIQALRETAGEIPYALPDLNPHARVREHVLRMAPGKRKMPLEQPLPGMFVIRESQQVWRRTPYPGVEVKILFSDPETRNITSLLKLQPGAKYPAHHHAGVEQCLMLEGSARLGQLVLERGDFGFACAGTNHTVVESDGGCLMMLISNQNDEVFA